VRRHRPDQPDIPDPPRPVPRWFFVRRMQAMVICGGVLGGLYLVIGIGLPILIHVLGGGGPPLANYQLDRHHVTTTGTVIRVQPVRYLSVGSKHPLDVTYSFRDQRDLEVTGCDRTYHYAWAESLKPNDSVAVIYNPRWPRINVLWLHGPNESRPAPALA